MESSIVIHSDVGTMLEKSGNAFMFWSRILIGCSVGGRVCLRPILQYEIFVRAFDCGVIILMNYILWTGVTIRGSIWICRTRHIHRGQQRDVLNLGAHWFIIVGDNNPSA